MVTLIPLQNLLLLSLLLLLLLLLLQQALLYPLLALLQVPQTDITQPALVPRDQAADERVFQDMAHGVLQAFDCEAGGVEFWPINLFGIRIYLVGEMIQGSG